MTKRKRNSTQIGVSLAPDTAAALNKWRMAQPVPPTMSATVAAAITAFVAKQSRKAA